MVARIHYRWDFIGLSTDNKPTPETSEKVVDGSTYYCSDNSKLYVWYKTQWYERKPLGGGGGGGSYTAGTGIDITDDTISVDTTTIQAKLTAGDNITITDDTISATDTTYSAFTGTDGTAAGTAGLVPAPATTDAGKFLKADGTWDTAGGGTTYTAGDGIDITNAVISATNTGKPKVLTSANYDYPDANPTGIALWRLEPGLYMVPSGTTAYYSQYFNKPQNAYNGLYLIAIDNNETSTNIFYFSNTGAPQFASTLIADGTRIAPFSYYLQVENSLTSDSASNALSANQGRILKDLVDSIAIRASGAPTTSTVGSVGTLYEDTTNGKLYQCTDITGGSYTWVEVGAGGGSGPTVVQTTGTSTTDVMSQNAVTSMIFADPATQYKIKIGAGTSTSEGSDAIEIGHNAAATKIKSIALGVGTSAAGNRSTAIGQASNVEVDNALAVGGAGVRYGSNSGVAIGYAAEVGVNKPGAIALGAYSSPSATGEMNIGSSNTACGYNSSNYRLLTGLYDGQSAHDAATLAQGNTLATTAPTTATVGVLGQLYTDTTNMHTYQCTAIDDTTDPSNPSYTWTQRW